MRLTLANLMMLLSLLVTLLLLGGAAANPCDWRGECAGAAIALGWWTMFHIFAALPMFASGCVLVRRVRSGNGGAFLGLAALVLNIVLSATLWLTLQPYWWWT